MDLRKVIVVLVLCCYLCVNGQLSVNFVGIGFYPAMSNATLSCELDPIPDDIEDIEVSWWIASDQPNKLAKSVANQNNSFIYDTANPDLKPRFSTSSARFAQGLADATIRSIKISDESAYSCDVEIGQMQKRTDFKVNVYQIPTVRIVNINTDLDIRPVEEQPTEAENPTDDGMDMGNSTASESTTEDATEEAGGGGEVEPTDPEEEPTIAVSSSEDGNVTIVHCVVEHVYPIPNNILFETNGGSSGLSWNIEPDNFYETLENEDGSFNVTARLRIEPTAELDGKTIICTSSITPRDFENKSPDSDVISVKHSTTRVHMNVSPSDSVNEDEEVTITCRADGNPAPEITLEKDGVMQAIADGRYTFTAKRESSGMYACKATNGDGEEFMQRAELLVHWMNDVVIKGPHNAIDVMEGNPIELQCSTESSDVVSYRWSSGNKYLPGSRSDILRFNPLEADDSGSYECQASTNRYSQKAEYILDVLVKCKPKLEYKVAASPVKSGNAHVTVTCKAEGNPTCNMMLGSFEGNKAVITENQAVLVIKNLPLQENPLKFNCTAENAYSSETTDITISDPKVCCKEMSSGGIGAGVIIIIVVVSILAIIGILVAFYVVKKRHTKKANLTKEMPNDDPEADKLTAHSEQDRI